MKHKNASLYQWIQKLPKVELHVHLEGSITKEMALKIWQKHNAAIKPSFIDELYGFKDFNGFLQSLIQTMRILQVEDFYDITCQVLDQAAANCILYSEVFFTPYLCQLRNDLPLHAVMESIEIAAKEKEKEKGVIMRLLFDAPRNCGIEAVWDTVRQAANSTSSLVIGVGLGGDEVNFPAHWFTAPFAYAKSMGLLRVLHAGETAGVESVEDAIYLLHANRIGHALGVTSNVSLVDYIKEQNITLDLNLTSNVKTKSITHLEAHPIKEYVRQALPVSINSDDPGFFQTDLTQELLTLIEVFQFTKQDCKNFMSNAVKGSVLSSADKRQFLESIALY